LTWQEFQRTKLGAAQNCSATLKGSHKVTEAALPETVSPGLNLAALNYVNHHPVLFFSSKRTCLAADLFKNLVLSSQIV
jgi:hypothetical protein